MGRNLGRDKYERHLSTLVEHVGKGSHSHKGIHHLKEEK